MNCARSWTLLLVASSLLTGSACTDFEIKNKMPIAVAAVYVGGMPIAAGKPVPYMGSPVAVTLDSRGSKDADGSITRALWLRTDATPNQRYAGNGLVDAGTFTAYGGDPPGGANPVVMLPLGKHRFSLWVVDNDGLTSAPATLSFEVKVPSSFMPDAKCMTAYKNTNKACAECVCSPMANKGCHEIYKTCYENTDAMFTKLCTDLNSCGNAGKCVGSACYAAAPLCMTQIMMAAAYMGGTLPASCNGEGASNPCAAASKLGACQNFDAMMADGPCREFCKF